MGWPDFVFNLILLIAGFIGAHGLGSFVSSIFNRYMVFKLAQSLTNGRKKRDAQDNRLKD